MLRVTGGFRHEIRYFFGCTTSVPRLVQRRRNKVSLHERSELRKTLRPRRSAVRHAQALRLSDTAVRRILHQDLNFKPYKLMIVQELNQQDFGRRTTFAETMLQMFEEDPELVILTSGEAHFHLNGIVNKQNFRYWSTINPRQVHEHPQHCVRVTVWAAVARFGVIGPYFFEENGRSVTVNSDRYVMIRNLRLPELRRRRLNQSRIWSQQDRATALTSREAMAELRRLFPGKLISHRGDVPWPPPPPPSGPVALRFLFGGGGGGTSKEKSTSTRHEIFLSCRMQLSGKCAPYLAECMSR